jgi:hypothetical protein
VAEGTSGVITLGKKGRVVWSRHDGLKVGAWRSLFLCVSVSCVRAPVAYTCRADKLHAGFCGFFCVWHKQQQQKAAGLVTINLLYMVIYHASTKITNEYPGICLTHTPSCLPFRCYMARYARLITCHFIFIPQSWPGRKQIF